MTNVQILLLLSKILAFTGIIVSVLGGFVNIKATINQDTIDNIYKEKVRKLNYTLAGIYTGVILSIALLVLGTLVYSKIIN